MARKINPADLEIWQEAMKDAKPNPARGKLNRQKPTREEFEKVLLDAPLDTPAENSEPVADSPKINPKKQNSLPPVKQPPTFLNSKNKKNKKKITIDGRVDLHGLTQEKAYGRLKDFLARAYSKDYKTVLVITGKGLHSGVDEFQRPKAGVLREALPRWVKSDKEIAAWVWGISPARRQDGGEGAFYLHLRR